MATHIEPRVPRPYKRGLSDEEDHAYYVGVEATLEAMRSDAVYYGLNLKPGQFALVERVADYIEGKSDE